MKYLDLKELRQALAECRERGLDDDGLRDLLRRLPQYDYPPEEIEQDITEAVSETRRR